MEAVCGLLADPRVGMGRTPPVLRACHGDSDGLVAGDGGCARAPGDAYGRDGSLA